MFQLEASIYSTPNSSLQIYMKAKSGFREAKKKNCCDLFQFNPTI